MSRNTLGKGMNYPWTGIVNPVAKKCLVCGDDGVNFILSSNGTKCLNCFGKKCDSVLFNEYYNDYEKAARQWCINNGYNYDKEVTNIESGDVRNARRIDIKRKS